MGVNTGDRIGAEVLYDYIQFFNLNKKCFNPRNISPCGSVGCATYAPNPL